MTTIGVMRDSFEGTDWKRAFAEALLRLVPDMNPDRADELSDGEYPHYRALEPTAAALSWVDRQTPVPIDGGESIDLDRVSNGR